MPTGTGNGVTTTSSRPAKERTPRATCSVSATTTSADLSRGAIPDPRAGPVGVEAVVVHHLHEARAGLAGRSDHSPFENGQDVVLDDHHRRSMFADVASSRVGDRTVCADPVPAKLGGDDVHGTVAQLPPGPGHDLDRFPTRAELECPRLGRLGDAAATEPVDEQDAHRSSLQLSTAARRPVHRRGRGNVVRRRARTRSAPRRLRPVAGSTPRRPGEHPRPPSAPASAAHTAPRCERADATSRGARRPDLRRGSRRRSAR